MRSPFLIAGALTLILASGTLLLPGCGGGGSSSGPTTGVPDLRFSRQKDIQFIDFPQYRGVLTVNFADQTTLPTRAAGTLQVVAVPNFKPATEAPVSFTVALPPGTYIVVGNVLDGTNGFDYDLGVSGSYQGGPKFRLAGNFDDDGLISISAPFKMGDSILRGRVVPPPVVPPVGTTTGGTTAGTTAGTTTGATTAGGTTGATTAGTTAGGTTGATTAGTTAGGTTGATTAGNTTAGGTTTGLTAGGTTGTTTSGGTTAGAITAGSTLAGGGGTTNPPMLP